MERKNDKIIIKESKNGKSKIMLGDMDISGFVSEYRVVSSGDSQGIGQIWLRLFPHDFIIQKGD